MDPMEWLLKNRYGSLELSRQIGPNLLRGLAGSVMLHGLVVVTFVVMALLNGGRPMEITPLPPPITIVPINPFRPLPPIRRELAKPTPPNPAAKPIAAIEDPTIDPTAPLTPTPPGVPGDFDWPGTSAGEPPVDTGPFVTGDPGEVIPEWGTYVLHEYEPEPLDINPQPAYPELARIGGVTGKVVALMYVDAHGNVAKWNIATVDPARLGFDDAVAEVIPKWKFAPALQQGKPVGVWISIPFTFTYKK